MDYKRTADDIVEGIGGQGNIDSMTHCATRLRFNLNNDDLVDEPKLKNIDGVLGVMNQGGTFQVIIGNEVPKVYAAMNELGRENALSASSEEQTKNNSESNKKWTDKLFGFISAVFTPILSAIIGAGLIKSILALAVLLGADAESTTYYFINFIGDAPLYFLPVMIAYTAATKLKANPFLAVSIAGAMLHPSYNALITDAFALNYSSLLGLPVTLATYSASVIPVLLMVIFQMYVERLCDRVIPKMIRFFFKPVVTILLVATVTFVVLGPIGFMVGVGVSNGLNALENYASWLVPTIIGAFFPVMVMTGMHYGVVPFMFQSFATKGYETISGPGGLPSNIAQGAASLAVAMKSKDSKLKQTAYTSGATALLGITEPAMFAVTLRFKRILPCVMVGGGLGGLYAGLMGVKTYSFTAPGLLSLVAYVGPDGWTNLIHSLVSMIIAFVVTFVMAWFWGTKDINQPNLEGEK